MSNAGRLNRRNALKMAAGGVTAGAFMTGGARAQEEESVMSMTDDTHPLAPGWHRIQFGDATVTTVLDGIRPGEGPFPTFGENQSAEAVGTLMEANGLPKDRFVNFFNTALVEIGDQLVLIDTGMGEGGRSNGMGLLVQRMAGAGYAPEDVDLVVLTHLHGDHIGGLMEGSAPAFPNARYATGRTELEFWTSDEAKNGPRADNAKAVESRVLPFREKMTLLEDGDEAVPGLTARAAFGHTPGMFAFELSSGGRRLFFMADTFSQFVVSFQHPEWEVRFDQDKAASVETRQRFAAMLADEAVALHGYHLPFPGIGYVQRDGDAYRFVPETYQSLVAG